MESNGLVRGSITIEFPKQHKCTKHLNRMYQVQVAQIKDVVELHTCFWQNLFKKNVIVQQKPFYIH